MNKFRIGDILRGTSALYRVTDTECVCQVTAESRTSGLVKVKVLSHENPSFQQYIGDEYTVESEYFELVPIKELQSILMKEFNYARV